MEERIHAETFLSLGELDALRDACQTKRHPVKGKKCASRKKGYVPPVPKVKTAPTFLYLTRIADYLAWLCQYYRGNQRFTKDAARRIDAFVTAIRERRPFIMGRNIDDEARCGVTEAQERLLGWSVGWGQGQHYAARHIRDQAHKAMLRDQERFEQQVRVALDK